MTQRRQTAIVKGMENGTLSKGTIFVSPRQQTLVNVYFPFQKMYIIYI